MKPGRRVLLRRAIAALFALTLGYITFAKSSCVNFNAQNSPTGSGALSATQESATCQAATPVEWLKECEARLLKRTLPLGEVLLSFSQSLKLDSSQYQSSLVPLDNHKTKGLLLLSKKVSPQPLIVFRGGIGSHAESFRAERHLLKIITNYLGYHVLFVGSSFNDQTMSESKFSLVGPLADVELNLDLAKLFRHKPLKKKVKSLHLVGLSMSGLGAYLTATREQSGYQSILLLCPLLEYPLLNSKNSLFSNPFVSLWAKFRFPKSLRLISESSHGFPLERLFSRLYDTQINLIKSGLYPWVIKSIPEPKSFPLILEYLLKKSKAQIPVSVILTQSDGIVIPKRNGGRLQELGHPVNWLAGGYHCAVGQSYPPADIALFFALLLDTHGN